MKSINYLLASLVLSLAQAAQVCHAGVNWPTQGARPLAEVKQFIASLDKHKYQQYTQVSYKAEVSVNLQKSVTHIEDIYYFPDDEAIQNYGSDYLSFNEALEQLDIFRLITISPKGEVHAFSPEDLKYKDDNSYSIFSSYKHAVYAFPHLEAGSFAVLEFAISRDLQKDESDWYREFYPQNTYDRENFQVDIHWSKDFPVHWQNTNPLTHCEADEQARHLTCSAKQLPKVETDARVFWADQLGHISLGQFSSWHQAAARAETHFAKSQTGDLSAVRRQVKNLTAEKHALEDKITSITQFVAQKIQYISLSEYGNAVTPHSVLRTLNKRMGDCKDKSALLVEMLQEIGVQAHPVLVATERLKLPSSPIPSLGVFDHMVVCFKQAKQTYCVDPTDKDVDWRYVSPYIQGRSALWLFANADLETIPAKDYRWRARFHSQVTFDAKGGQREEQKREYRDEYASVMRGRYLGMSDKELDKDLLETYQNTISDEVKPRFSVTGLEDREMSVVITSSANYKPFLKPKQDLNYTEADAWLKKVLDDSTIDNKRYEYQTSGVWINSQVVWDISANWKTKALPASLNLSNKYGELTRAVKRLGAGKIQIDTELKIPRRLVASDELEAYNKFINLLRSESELTGTGWALNKN